MKQSILLSLLLGIFVCLLFIAYNNIDRYQYNDRVVGDAYKVSVFDKMTGTISTVVIQGSETTRQVMKIGKKGRLYLVTSETFSN